MIILIAVFTLSIGVATSQTTETNQLATFFAQKCQNVTRDTKIFDKIFYESGEFSKELSHAFQNLPQNKKVFCNDNKSSLIKNFNSIVGDLELCFLPREKYLADFMRNSFSQFLHFLCHNNGEHVDNFFRASASQCRATLESSTDDRVGKCFEKIFKPTAGYLAKKDLCDDLNTAKKCFDVVLDEKCPSYGSFKNLNSQLFQYISTPCSSCINYFSTILLTMSLILSYLARQI